MMFSPGLAAADEPSCLQIPYGEHSGMSGTCSFPDTKEPLLPKHSASWKLYPCKHLLPLYLPPLFFMERPWRRGNRRGLAHPPSPWPLGNKGMQLEGQEFLEQYGWGEKVITCLGFHCGNGRTFPWESLVSGGTERRERGRREQRGRERAGSSMGRKEKGKGIFFFACSHGGAEMNYLSPKPGRWGIID